MEEITERKTCPVAEFCRHSESYKPKDERLSICNDDMYKLCEARKVSEYGLKLEQEGRSLSSAFCGGLTGIIISEQD